ncbi:hypothetical protein GH733_014873 [Mirounga leonina]|nr:hypothetical protein GH733_014873 [Mirounga leonina]
MGGTGNKSESDGTTKPEASFAAHKTEAAVTFTVMPCPGWRSRSDRLVPASSAIHSHVVKSWQCRSSWSSLGALVTGYKSFIKDYAVVSTEDALDQDD